MHLIPQLSDQKSILHGVSTTAFGNMDFRFGDKNEVINNRKKFFEKLRIPYDRSVFIEVIHGTKIIKVTSSLCGVGNYSQMSALKADALITNEKNIALVLLTADCVPVIMYDNTNQILALVHVSRHNSRQAFVQKVLSNLKSEYSVNITDLKIYLGPSIKKSSYLLPDYPDGYDLIGDTLTQLQLKGAKKDNIFVDDIDTCKSDDFFSHYRSVRSKEAEKRFATVVMLI